MPTRTTPWTAAERARRYRQRQREELLYAVADVPLRLAEVRERRKELAQ